MINHKFSTAEIIIRYPVTGDRLPVTVFFILFLCHIYPEVPQYRLRKILLF
jgi:hypothetical protein